MSCRLSCFYFALIFLTFKELQAQSFDLADISKTSSHFLCKDQGVGRFRPYYMKNIEATGEYIDYSRIPKGLLGQNPMASLQECMDAVADANSQFGVICSRTGLNGWKPTIYTGTKPGRADFGYLGGSTIVQFSDCLTATRNSSEKGVCFWGGSDWYVSPIDHEGVLKGPYRALKDCVAQTKIE